MPRDRDEKTAEANRLYWESDLPVAEIAERLGISRRTLYDRLIPAETGIACPECGGELVYTNRSARMAGEAVCRVCGTPQDLLLLEELTGAEREAAAPEPAAQEAAGPGPAGPGPTEDARVPGVRVGVRAGGAPPLATLFPQLLGESLEEEARERRRLLLAAGAAGLAFGVTVMLLVRTRRRRRHHRR